MKIVDQRGTATRFDDIDVGDYFYVAENVGADDLCLKIPALGTGTEEPATVNAVHMKNGHVECFKCDIRVQVVEVDIFVTSNTPERPA